MNFAVPPLAIANRQIGFYNAFGFKSSTMSIILNSLATCTTIEFLDT